MLQNTMNTTTPPKPTDSQEAVPPQDSQAFKAKFIRELLQNPIAVDAESEAVLSAELDLLKTDIWTASEEVSHFMGIDATPLKDIMARPRGRNEFLIYPTPQEFEYYESVYDSKLVPHTGTVPAEVEVPPVPPASPDLRCSTKRGLDFCTHLQRGANKKKHRVKKRPPVKIKSTAEQYAKLLSKSVGENASMVDKIENLVLFLYRLSECQTFGAVTANMISYVKTFMDGPIAVQVTRLIETVMSYGSAEVLEAHSGLEQTDVLGKMRAFIDSWKLNREGPLAKYLCNIVSLLCFAQLFPVLGEKPGTKGEIDVDGFGMHPEGGAYFKGYKIFSAKVLERQISCSDLSIMAAETALFFLERGKLAFTLGNPAALVYSDAELIELDLEFSVLESCIPLIDSGRLSQFKHEKIDGIKDELDYGIRLDALINKLIAATAEKKMSAQGKADLTSKLTRLTKVKVALLSAQQSRPQRVRPFSVEIFGASAVGKSVINSAILRQVCCVNEFPDELDTRVTVNENDKFESEITAKTVCVTIDDFGNTKPEFMSESPVKKIIDHVNNVTRNALKADVASKGNVPVQPKVFTTTTNKKDLNAHVYSVEPVSILRRFDYVLTAILLPSHTVDGAFSKEAFVRDKNAWNILIEKICLVGPVPPKKESTAKYIPIGVFTLADALRFLGEASIQHFKDQNELIEQIEDNMSKPLCPHGVMEYVCQQCNTNVVPLLPIDVRFAASKDVDSVLKAGTRLAKVPCDDEELTVVSRTAEQIVADDTGEMSDHVDKLESQAGYIDEFLPSISTEYTDDSAPFFEPQAGDSDLLLSLSGGEPLPSDRGLEFLDAMDGDIHEPPAGPDTRSYYAKVKDTVKSGVAGIKVEERVSNGKTKLMSYLDGTSVGDFLRDAIGSVVVIYSITSYHARTFKRFYRKFYENFTCEFPMRPARWWDCMLPNAYGTNFRSLARLHGYVYFVTFKRGVRLKAKATIKSIFESFYASRTSVIAGAVTAALFIFVKCYTAKKRSGRPEKIILKEQDDCTELTGFTSGVDIGPRRPETVAEETLNLKAHEGITPIPHDEEVDVWKKPVREMRKRNGKKGATADQLAGMVSKHLHKLENVTTGKWSNIFPLRGNYWLAPGHMFPQDDEAYHIKLKRSPRSILDKNVRAVADRTTWRRIPDSDFLVLQIVSAGDQPNLLEWISERAENAMNVRHCKMVTKTSDCTIELRHIHVESWKEKIVTNPSDAPKTRFSGYTYEGSASFHTGFCMSPVVAHTKCPSIVCFHLAGVTRTTPTGKEATNSGAGGYVCPESIQLAIDCFDQRLNVMNSGVFPVEALGIKYGIDRPLHPYNAVAWQREVDGVQPSAVFIGAHDGARMNPKSCVRLSPISALVTKHLGIAPAHKAPDFKKSGHARQKALEDMTHPSHSVVPEILQRAVDDLIRYKLSKYSAADLEQVTPMSIDHACSGMDGIRGIDRMPLTTSCGFPLNCAKSKLARVGMKDVEGVTESVEYDKIVHDHLAEIKACYDKEERAYHICRLILKDEARPVEKDSIRAMTAGQLAFNILYRQLFLPVGRMDHAKWKELEGTVGINAHGPEWTELSDQLDCFGNDIYIAGDYSKYDKRTSPNFVRSAYAVQIAVAAASGNYTKQELDWMVGIATDVSYPVYENDGAFLQMFASMPSGIPGTTDLNVDQNSLYMRYAFFTIFGLDTELKFEDHVKLKVYGDDNAMGVSSHVPKFNHTSVKKVLSTIGVDYTMADKGSESRPYISKKELSFLKRGFRKEDKLGEVLAPLEEDSIMKSLHFYYDGGSDTLPEDISSDAIECAMREWFNWGKLLYDVRYKQMMALNAECDFVHPKILTFDEQVTSYAEKHHGFERIEESVVFEPHASDCHTDDTWVHLLDEQPVMVDDFGAPPAHVPVAYQAQAIVQAVNNAPNIPYTYTNVYDAGRGPVDQPRNSLEPHAGDDDASPVTQETEEVVTFAASSPGWKVDASISSDERLISYDGSHANFFARPVVIHTFSWEPDVDYYENISPWELYMTDSKVVNRLNHFKMFKGNLHLRLYINGSPFSQGCMMCSYFPYNFINDEVVPTEDNGFLAIQESQRQHIMLDPTNSTGGDLVLPFTAQFDMLSVDEYTFFGPLTFRSLNELRHANGATTSLTVTVTAWMDNMELSAPSAVDAVSLIPQSGESDEYGKGALSKPATAVANAAGALAKMPAIAPYAQAAQLGARMVASVASAFGFSRPSIIQDDCTMNPRPMGNMASCYSGDTAVKLSTDPKQGVSIGSEVVGVSKNDDMNIARMCQIPSFITNANYAASAAPGLEIARIPIQPVQYRYSPISDSLFLTPSALAAMPFTYWRGTINVTLKIIASNYQRGRLRVTFEPNAIADTSAEPEYNVIQSYLIDIAEDTTTTFKIGWGSTPGMLRVPSTGVTSTTDFAYVVSPGTANGILSVYTATNLISPGVDPVAVEVQVWVSTGPDVEFAAPTATGFTNGTWFPGTLTSQAGIEGEDHKSPDEPDNVGTVHWFSPMNTSSELLKIYHGEKITSFRALIKRYHHIRTLALLQDSDVGNNIPGMYRYSFPLLIGHRGLSDTAFDTTIDGDAWNYISMTPLHWLLPSFMGYRGGLRYKVVPVGDYSGFGANTTGAVSIQRADVSYPPNGEFVELPNGASAVPHYGVQTCDGTSTGMELQPTLNKGCVEAEVPYHSIYRWSRARLLSFGSLGAQFEPEVTIKIHAVSSNKRKSAHMYLAAADDFSLMYFIGVPPLKIVSTPAPGNT
ncbi:TPA_asm: polyprotein [Strongylocentrotus purpuratus associated pircornavirus 1]|nr:TPA_asm: polyprotein [Strongylocentrotus purpuratus associated pircornavirus 1]DAZ87518.1 TPA_asm: polyprotein [Strongylocentrotus purpuratus associated pircornavirus 3]